MSARRMDSQWRETEYERNARLRKKRLAASQKEAVPSGTACQSAEQAVPETTTNDAQRD